MAQCPNCSAEINDDFGLIDCSGCGLALLIGIDGDVQMAKVTGGEGPPAIPEVHPTEVTNRSFVSTNNPSFSTEVSPMAEEATSFNFAVDQELSEPVENEIFTEGQFEVREEVSQGENDEFTSFDQPPEPSQVRQNSLSFDSTETDGDPVQESTFLNEAQTNFLANEEIEKAQNPEPQTGLADLSAFANSSQSSLKDGYVKYKLYIGGIDTTEIKKIVFEELSDKRLLLDIKELSRQIVGGNLCIDPLSAVKASVLINKLKSAGVTLAWDQYDIRKT